MLLDFFADESGAVNTDWVALSSSLLLLGMAIIFVVYGFGVEGTVNDINATLKGHGAGIPMPPTPDFTD